MPENKKDNKDMGQWGKSFLAKLRALIILLLQEQTTRRNEYMVDITIYTT